MRCLTKLLPFTLIAVLAGCTEKKPCTDPTHNFRAYNIVDAETGDKIMGFGGQPRKCDTVYIHDTVYLNSKNVNTQPNYGNMHIGGVQ